MKNDLKLVSTDSSDPLWKGNPFLKWIPSFNGDADMIKWLAADPFRNPAWCKLHQDFDLLPNYLDEVFVPTPATVRLANTLLTVLRKSYALRDPGQTKFWTSHFYAKVDLDLTFSKPNSFRAEGISISGITGVGKTRTIDRVLSLLPQTVKHQNLGGHLASNTQIVWLKLDMSTAGGLAELLRDLLFAINTCLEIDEEPRGRISVGEMIPEIIRKLKTHCCGMLVFDELQNINFGKSVITERVRVFILKLLNNGIPVVLAGNPRGFTFMENGGQSSQLVRRMAAVDRVRLDPSDGPDEADWQILVRGLWRCQLLPKRTPITCEAEEVLFRLTGGFPAMLIRLLAESQKLAARHGQECLTVPIIQTAARDSPFLKELKPLIDAFVAKDPFRLQVYSDIDWNYFQSKWADGMVRGNGDLPLGREYHNSLRPQVTAMDIVSKDQKALKASGKRRAKNATQTNGSASTTAQGNFYLDAVVGMINENRSKKDGG